MDIKPFKKVVCRTPAYDMDATLDESFETLKDRIALASYAFDNLISPLGFHKLGTTNQKTLYTLWKYFNRSKYRCTPYGTFASISSVDIATSNSQLVLDDSMTPNRFPDWSQKDKIFDKITRERRANRYLRNSTVYFFSDQIRFIRCIDSEFRLTSVASTPEIVAVLTLCRNPTRLEDLLKFLYQCFLMDDPSSRQLISQMETLQLINNNNWPNIVGEDYFSRVDHLLEPAASDYIIAKRKVLSGGMDLRLVNGMIAYIKFASKFVHTKKSRSLTEFKEKYLKRFEGQAMTLARAMDPEIGIGYGDLEQPLNASKLISSLKSDNMQYQSQTSSDHSEIKVFLLKKLIEGKEIKLQDFSAEGLTRAATLPNTFSILFEIYEGRPVISFAGGSSANALLGRFTLASESVNELVQEVASIEQSSNPEVLFFDVGYQTQQRIDNVNRRKKIYPLELSILGWNNDDVVLDMEDIMVAVQDNQVILFSKRFGKRLVPRIPSAYNSGHSDLGIFRFLSDLQHQDLTTDLSINIMEAIPNLDNYPRVSFKELIISPQTWLYPNDHVLSEAGIIEWFEQKAIHKPIKAGNADQTLVFDPLKTEDIKAFYFFAKQQKGGFYVQEALIDAIGKPKDELGKKYHAQYIASFFHPSTIYAPIRSVNDATPKAEVPGGEWIYYELEVHPSSSNELLQKIDSEFLKANKKSIKKWFFIRYTDPRPHIRLRLQLKEKSAAFKLTGELGGILTQEITSGKVRDLQLKTYKKETYRFGEQEMDSIEFIFYLDSQFVIKQLDKKSSEEELMHTALYYLSSMIERCLPDRRQAHSFIANMAKNFASEASLDHSAFKEINANFRAQMHSTKLKIPHASGYLNRVAGQLCKILDQPKRETLLADLIHLHINRLFQSDQRLYEAVIYQQLQILSKVPRNSPV